MFCIITFILSLWTGKAVVKINQFVHFEFLRFRTSIRGVKRNHFVHFVYFLNKRGDKINHFVYFVDSAESTK